MILNLTFTKLIGDYFYFFGGGYRGEVILDYLFMSAACEDDEVLREDEKLKKLQEQIDHYRASIDSLDPTDNSNKLIIGKFEWAVKELKDLQSKEF